MVVDAVTRAQSRLSELLAAIPALRLNSEHSDAQHSELVAAVLRGDPDVARRVMEDHCDATSALIRGLLG
jgi:GntR family transcriptional repressor for pyruvate dehydrogenase complex